MRYLLLAALLAGIPPLHALDPRKALTQFSSTTWTQEQGLPQDTVRAIAQTPDGYLWVGTDEGLARFDGYDFVTFTKDQGFCFPILLRRLPPAAMARSGSAPRPVSRVIRTDGSAITRSKTVCLMTRSRRC